MIVLEEKCGAGAEEPGWRNVWIILDRLHVNKKKN